MGSQGEEAVNLVLGIVRVQRLSRKAKDDVTRRISLAFWDKDARGSPYRYAEVEVRRDETSKKMAERFRKLANDIDSLGKDTVVK